MLFYGYFEITRNGATKLLHSSCSIAFLLTNKSDVINMEEEVLKTTSYQIKYLRFQGVILTHVRFDQVLIVHETIEMALDSQMEALKPLET